MRMFHALADRAFDLDRQLFLFGNISLRSDWLDVIVPFFSLAWLMWVMGLVIFTLCLIRTVRRGKNPRLILAGAALLLVTTGTADLITNEVKGGIGRLRPYQSLPYAHYHTERGWRQNPPEFTPRKTRSDSFFSSHAANSMAVAVIAAGFFPAAAPVIYVVPLLSGFSRVYMGKHYPGDVLGGWIAGWLIAITVRGIAYRLWRRRQHGLVAYIPASENKHHALPTATKPMSLP